jgi:hypothetical protein
MLLRALISGGVVGFSVNWGCSCLCGLKVGRRDESQFFGNGPEAAVTADSAVHRNRIPALFVQPHNLTDLAGVSFEGLILRRKGHEDPVSLGERAWCRCFRFGRNGGLPPGLQGEVGDVTRLIPFSEPGEPGLLQALYDEARQGCADRVVPDGFDNGAVCVHLIL